MRLPHLLLGVLCAVPTAAPVPAPPARLTPALVVGRWDVHEGGWHGEMIFGPDGVYSWHVGDAGTGAWGLWWVTARGTLRLSECPGGDVHEWEYAGFDLRGSPRELRARGWRLISPDGPGVSVRMLRMRE